MNRPLILTALVAIALSLAGCGNKGALVLPGTPVDTDAPAADAPPADASPAEAPAQPPPVPAPAKDDGGTPALSAAHRASHFEHRILSIAPRASHLDHGAPALDAAPIDAAPRAPLRFTKMHGAGNDFVVIDLRNGPRRRMPDCAARADRRTGIGCDQILTIEPPRSGAAASYRIWNADGSPSQQCGNGARCVAAWVLRHSVALDPERCLADRFALDSPAGTHAVEVIDLQHYRVAMGRPEFLPARIPLRGFEAAQDAYIVEIDGAPCAFGAVSMGNPHAVIEVDDIRTAPLATLAPALQRHAAFPESVNVGFAEVVARDRIKLRVFERGVGETLACGSGACAAAAVLIRRGRIDREVAVELPGGTLRIAWPDDGAQIAMAGPAAFVFEGEWRQ